MIYKREEKRREDIKRREDTAHCLNCRRDPRHAFITLSLYPDSLALPSYFHRCYHTGPLGFAPCGSSWRDLFFHFPCFSGIHLFCRFKFIFILLSFSVDKKIKRYYYICVDQLTTEVVK
jgi:hypothetical protein